MASDFSGKVVALSGGVGGAKLALGLCQCLDPEQLLIVANTADDFEHLGLSISPDLDSVMYALAGINDQQRGWGLSDESWQMMGMLADLGGETWFQLGDRDLATHLQRSQLLASGLSLSQVTWQLCQALGIRHRLVPMSDDPVRTRVMTDRGELGFQEYFVREQCAPAVSGFRFDGADSAPPQPEWLAWLRDPELAAVIICPSNPFVSVEPMLSLPGVRAQLAAIEAPVLAVSPIVAGLAIKGPAAKMMAELEMPATAAAVAQYYGDLLDGFVMDRSDADQAQVLSGQGMVVSLQQTLMRSLKDRTDLARATLDFARQLA